MDRTSARCSSDLEPKNHTADRPGPQGFPGRIEQERRCIIRRGPEIDLVELLPRIEVPEPDRVVVASGGGALAVVGDREAAEEERTAMPPELARAERLREVGWEVPDEETL